jgi:hypothetical protein
MKNALALIAALAFPGAAWAQAEADPPTALQQFQADGVTPIAEGGTATSTTIVVSGVVHGSGAALVRLEVEIRMIADPFQNVSTHQGGVWVPVNSTQSITISGLVPGASYHWQATTVPT